MRALWIPLLIPLLILATYLGWSWYQVKYVMDELIKSAAPYASVTYDSIPLAFKGEYTVKGIKVDLFDSGAITSIRSAQLKSDDWQSMLLQGTPFQQDALPESISLSLTGVEFDTGVQAEGTPLVAMMLQQPIADGCLKEGGQPVMLEDLALGTLYSDIVLSYRFNPENQILNASLNTNTAKIWSMGVGVDFDIEHRQLNKKLLEKTPPRILSATIEALDQGYNQKIIDVCTQSGNVTEEEFVQRSLEGLKAQLAPLGIEIPEPLLAYYSELFEPGASFEAALDFISPMPIGGTSTLMADVDFLNSIELKVSINQKTFDITSSLQTISQKRQSASVESAVSPEVDVDGRQSIAEDQVAEPLAQFKSSAVEVEEQPKKLQDSLSTQSPVEKLPAKKKAEFEVVLVGQINQSVVGKKVKADTVNGHLVEGEIIKVLNNRMLIKQEIGNGTAEIPLMFKNVYKLRVK